MRVVKDQGVHTETLNSRDELRLIPGNLVESGRHKTEKLGIGEVSPLSALAGETYSRSAAAELSFQV